jgi:hypothetical protein
MSFSPSLWTAWGVHCREIRLIDQQFVVTQSVKFTADRHSDKIIEWQIVLEDDNGSQLVLLEIREVELA